MPRSVDKSKIREVIEELQRQGQPLTLQVIRDRVGGGSFTTLLAVLQQWRAERQQQVEQDRGLEQAMPVPEEVWEQIRRAIATAWRLAVEKAEEENRALRAHLTEVERRLREEVDGRQQDAAMAEAEIRELEALLAQAQEEVAAARQQLVAAQSEARTLREFFQQSLQFLQLAESKVEETPTPEGVAPVEELEAVEKAPAPEGVAPVEESVEPVLEAMEKAPTPAPEGVAPAPEGAVEVPRKKAPRRTSQSGPRRP